LPFAKEAQRSPSGGVVGTLARRASSPFGSAHSQRHHVDPASEEAERVSTASVMEARIAEVQRELAQLEAEFPGSSSSRWALDSLIEADELDAALFGSDR